MEINKKYAKWGIGILLSPVALFIVLTLLLYIPAVQKWAVDLATEYASDHTGLDIRIDRVRLAFPLDLSVGGVNVVQQNDSMPQVKDTVANVHDIAVSVQLMPLFKGQVNIDRLDLNKVKMNTTNFIHEARVKGTVGQLSLRSHGIDLHKQSLRVDEARLADARVSVELSDTVKKDTTKTKNLWKIAVDRLDIANTDVTVHMPGDTLRVQAMLDKASARHGLFDLGKEEYSLKSLDWQGGFVKYDNRFEPRLKGLDTNHILLSDVNLAIDSLFYHAPRLDLAMRQIAFREKSGISVTRLNGHIALDSTRVILPKLSLSTPESSLTAAVTLDMNAFSDKNPGKVQASIEASIGKQDIMRFMGGMPTEFIRRWPNQPLSIKGSVRGNMRRIDIGGISLRLPTALTAFAKGYAANVTDPRRLKANVMVDAHAHNLDFITTLMDAQTSKMVRIPQGIAVKGMLKADGSRYSADIVASEGGGKVKAKGYVDVDGMAYDVAVDAVRLQLQHFLPTLGLSPFSGKAVAKGRGTDMFSRRTRLSARAEINDFHYAGYDLSGMKADATVADGHGNANLEGHNSLIDGLITANMLMQKHGVTGTFSCDLRTADLYALHITKKPVQMGMCGHIDLDTNMKEHHKLSGFVSDITIRTEKQTFRPADIMVDALTRRDTTRARLRCGDFSVSLNARGGYERLTRECQKFIGEMNKQLADNYIDQLKLRRKLPTMCIKLNAGRDNVFCRALRALMGYDLALADIDMATSPIGGINGTIGVDSLIVDSVRLDTVRLRFYSDSTNMNYAFRIRNNRRNKFVFTALLDGGLHQHGAYADWRLYDAQNKLGLGIDLSAAMENGGVRISLQGDDPIIGYKRFKANEGNYIFLGSNRRLSANLNLIADDGTGFQIYTNDSTEALRDLTVGFNQIDLAQVTRVIPYMPRMGGKLNGDMHLIRTNTETSISSAIGLQNFSYEGCPMGDLGSEFIYMPKGDGTHYVNGTLTCNDREVSTLEGTYNAKSNDIKAQLALEKTPLRLINGFIPQQIIGFRGTGDGTLSVKGNVAKPLVDGEIMLDSAYLFSEPYGVEMRFDNDPVRIVGSHLLFENFEMHSHNNSTLISNGELDFSDPSQMRLDLRMRADKFLLIDSKQTRRSEAFGKAYVNFAARIKGPVSNLNMLGKLDVLGSTDMTYVLKDSPLSTDNQLEGLVKFTDLNNPGATHVERPAPSGFTMDMTINVDQAAHVVCMLNADQSNYIDIEGGGTLRMVYNPIDDMRLTGRYTLNNGEMKYSLPVIPLKTFNIQDGSYIEFRGDPMNPRLNITALEEVRAEVTGSGDQTRTVLFNCGVEITKTLNDMGLTFVISAPEDLTLNSELQTMSKEERGKIAVTMLTTGMYLADGNTSKFSMNSALSAFLQSQINSISGNALRTLDLSFGMDNATDATGATHTDYSFKFAKRFWNNRLRIIVGGKVSTGADVQNQNESFFNNVTFEYRLSDTSNKYLKLFYNRDSYDWLEGDVGEYGAGFMWRRKLRRFRDIFNFKKETDQMPPSTIKKDSSDNRKGGINTIPRTH